MKFLKTLFMTFIMLWLVSGPHFEGLTIYTALSFLGGILSGILWGGDIIVWLVKNK